MSEEHPAGEAQKPEGEAQKEPAQKPPKDKAPESVRSTFGTVVFAVLIALAIRMVACEPFQIEGPSMEPTLLDGDRVVVSKFAYGLTLYFVEEALFNWSEPSLGDVVILTSTAADKAVIVKRVIGVGGDVIEFKGDLAYRNDAPLRVEEIGPCDETEQRHPDTTCRRYKERVGEHTFTISQSEGFDGFYESRRVIVPEGHVYVVGDHRDESRDSRAVGTIPVSRVKGRVELIYFSVSGEGDVRTPRIFQSVE